MLKKPLAALVAATAILTAPVDTASAADLPIRVAPPLFAPVPAATFTWTGFYVGGNAGYAFNNRSGMEGNAPGFGLYVGGSDAYHIFSKGDGTGGGLQLGYNRQFGVGSGIVVGVEADADYTNLSRSLPLPLPGPYSVLSETYRTSLDGIGTIRGRLGYAFGPLLVYGTGGFAYGIADHQVVMTAPGLGVQSRVDLRSVDLGYVAGGGMEYALPIAALAIGTVSVKAEYLHYQLDQQGAPLSIFGKGLAGRISDSGNLARVGFNYKF